MVAFDATMLVLLLAENARPPLDPATGRPVEHARAMQRLSAFRIEPFGARAAVELAMMTWEAQASGDKFEGEQAPWQRVKLDRQIVSIAKVAGAGAIYSDDEKLGRFAGRAGLQVVRLADLPLPAEDAQMSFPEWPPGERSSSEEESLPTDALDPGERGSEA